MNPSKLDVAISWLDRTIEFLLFIITMVMLAAGVAQVFCRYILNSSLSWSEELMRYLYVWMTLVGTSLAVRRKQFTTIEAVYNKICSASSAAGNALMVLCIILQIGFFIMLAVYGQQLAAKNMMQSSPAMGVSVGIAYMIFPIGGWLGIIYSLIELYDRFGKGKGGNDE